MPRVFTETATPLRPPTCLWTYQSRAGRYCFIFSTPHILILLAALHSLRRVPAESYGPGERQKPAAEFVEHTLQKVKGGRGREAYEKAKEVVEEGGERGSMTLKGFERRDEVGGK